LIGQFSIANPQKVFPLPEVALEAHALGNPEAGDDAPLDLASNNDCRDRWEIYRFGRGIRSMASIRFSRDEMASTRVLLRSISEVRFGPQVTSFAVVSLNFRR
jgi:hypothetical protein